MGKRSHEKHEFYRNYARAAASVFSALSLRSDAPEYFRIVASRMIKEIVRFERSLLKGGAKFERTKGVL